MAFDSDDDDIPHKGPVRKIGVKRTNEVGADATKADIKAAFEKKADDAFSKIEEYKQQMWDLSLKYKSFVESKVLAENKGPIVANLEAEVLNKLTELASHMNEDETQPQAIGSTALCMLLMKCMLLQRDAINALSYKLDRMQKKQQHDDI